MNERDALLFVDARPSRCANTGTHLRQEPAGLQRGCGSGRGTSVLAFDRVQLVLHESGLQGRGEVENCPEVISGPWWSYPLAWFLRHVFLPHAASVVGMLLPYLGYHGSSGR
jgi:hypothetical protein